MPYLATCQWSSLATRQCLIIPRSSLAIRNVPICASPMMTAETTRFLASADAILIAMLLVYTFQRAIVGDISTHQQLLPEFSLSSPKQMPTLKFSSPWYLKLVLLEWLLHKHFPNQTWENYILFGWTKMVTQARTSWESAMGTVFLDILWDTRKKAATSSQRWRTVETSSIVKPDLWYPMTYPMISWKHHFPPWSFKSLAIIIAISPKKQMPISVCAGGFFDL